MQVEKLDLIPTERLVLYCHKVSESSLGQYQALKGADLRNGAFSFYTPGTAVFSPIIEGEAIELHAQVK
jgi:hypothetical protein